MRLSLQEAQFEQLTRELEAERQSVANQLEKVSRACSYSNLFFLVFTVILDSVQLNFCPILSCFRGLQERTVTAT